MVFNQLIENSVSVPHLGKAKSQIDLLNLFAHNGIFLEFLADSIDDCFHLFIFLDETKQIFGDYPDFFLFKICELVADPRHSYREKVVDRVTILVVDLLEE